MISIRRVFLEAFVENAFQLRVDGFVACMRRIVRTLDDLRQDGHHPLEVGYFDSSLALDLNQAFISYAKAPGARTDIVDRIKTSLDTYKVQHSIRLSYD